MNFVITAISSVLNVARDLPDLQAPPQPCYIKNKTDSDNTGLDNNNKKKENDLNTK